MSQLYLSMSHTISPHNLSYRHSTIDPILTDRHRWERLHWAQQISNWRHQQWWTMLLSSVYNIRDRWPSTNMATTWITLHGCVIDKDRSKHYGVERNWSVQERWSCVVSECCTRSKQCSHSFSVHRSNFEIRRFAVFHVPSKSHVSKRQRPCAQPG